MTKKQIDHETFVAIGNSPEPRPPSDEHWRARREAAAALRRLNTALITADVPTQTLLDLAVSLRAQADGVEALPRIYGRRAMKEHTKQYMAQEISAVVGWSNAASIPMVIWRQDGRMHARFTPDWSLEGPTNHIHGGIIAGVFDHFLGVSQHGFDTGPGGTAMLTVRYHHPTPLDQPLHLIAELKRVDGRKKTISAEMWCGDIRTASCEALFVSNRQAPAES